MELYAMQQAVTITALALPYGPGEDISLSALSPVASKAEV